MLEFLDCCKQCPCKIDLKVWKSYGPSGIDEFIAANIKVLNFGLSFPVLINTVREGKIFEDEKFSIHACKANHSIVAFSYRFDEKDKPGRFNVENAKELGIPEGELWNKLQNGNEITINDKTIIPQQVLGEARPGKKNWNIRRYNAYKRS